MRAFALALLLAAQASSAQESAPLAEVPRNSVLLLDYEELFTRSDFGRRVTLDIQNAGRALIEENARIEAELTAEELLLTTQRETVSPEEFRALADAFDEKVQRMRAEQDEKARQLGAGQEGEQERFRQLVTPIIARIMRDTGSGVVIDRSQAVVWAESVDITPIVLEQVNRALGAGPEDPAADNAPATDAQQTTAEPEPADN